MTFALVVTFFLTWLLTRRILRGIGLSGVTNPVLVLAVAWSGQLLVLAWNPLEWHQPSTSQLVLVGLCVLLLQWSVVLTVAVSPGAQPPVTSVEPRPEKWATLFTLLAMLLLAVHVSTVGVLASGPTPLLGLRETLRDQGAPSIGFYFFYPAMVAALLWWAAFLAHRRAKFLVFFVLCSATLPLTSARTTLLFVLAASGFSIALNNSEVGRRLKVRYVMAISVFTVAIFNLVGRSVGKTYANSAAAQVYGSDPPIPEWLVQPFLYWVTPASALSVQLDAGLPPDGFWQRLASPIAQMNALLSGSTFSTIQDFVHSPWPTNVYTMFGPYFRSLGVPSALLALVITGVLLGMVFRLAAHRASPYSDVIAGSLLTVLAISPFDHVGGHEYLWVIIAVMFLLDRWDQARVAGRNALKQVASPPLVGLDNRYAFKTHQMKGRRE